jgi:hypothetical protein
MPIHALRRTGAAEAAAEFDVLLDLVAPLVGSTAAPDPTGESVSGEQAGPPDSTFMEWSA